MTKTLALRKTHINIEALDADLQAALGAAYLGLSRRADLVRVHLAQQTPTAAVQQVRHIVQQHDPNQLTPRQQRRLLLERDLGELRSANTAALDAAKFADAPELVQVLALKIRWLEQEMRDLRGLMPEDAAVATLQPARKLNQEEQS